MGLLFDVKASLTTHQQGVSETVTIGGYNGVLLQALARHPRMRLQHDLSLSLSLTV